MTVSGAYGRDYKSLKTAKIDWNADKDFIIRDIFRGSGTYINKSDAKDIKEAIMVRYDEDRKFGQLN